MENIPTAEEFLELWKDSKYPISYQMKQFAKLHVEAALKAAADTAEVNFNSDDFRFAFESCYPLNDIK
jgi:hypothetical protein